MTPDVIAIATSPVAAVIETEKEFEDVAYFEVDYLKAFQITPKKRMPWVSNPSR